MKYLFSATAAVLLALAAFATQPQGHGRHPERSPRIFAQKDPAQLAQEETERLSRLVLLSDRQYRKIYNFNKRQFKALQRKMEDGRPAGRDMLKQQEKRARKYRSVLNAAQYEKWASFEAERNFRRMREILKAD